MDGIGNSYEPHGIKVDLLVVSCTDFGEARKVESKLVQQRQKRNCDQDRRRTIKTLDKWVCNPSNNCGWTRETKRGKQTIHKRDTGILLEESASQTRQETLPHISPTSSLMTRVLPVPHAISMMQAPLPHASRQFAWQGLSG